MVCYNTSLPTLTMYITSLLPLPPSFFFYFSSATAKGISICVAKYASPCITTVMVCVPIIEGAIWRWLEKNSNYLKNAPHTRKSLVKGERFIRYVWRAWVWSNTIIQKHPIFITSSFWLIPLLFCLWSNVSSCKLSHLKLMPNIYNISNMLQESHWNCL